MSDNLPYHSFMEVKDMRDLAKRDELQSRLVEYERKAIRMFKNGLVAANKLHITDLVSTAE